MACSQPAIQSEATDSHTPRSWWQPDKVVLQTAGYAGVVAGGPGWDLGTDHALSLLVGYVPKGTAPEELWQLTLKYAYRPIDPVPLNGEQAPSRWHPLHLGLGLVYGHHDRLFLRQPERYPPDYYPPTALLPTITVGTSQEEGSRTVFLEFTMLARSVDAFFSNRRYFAEQYELLGLEAIGSLAFGLRIGLP